MKKIVSSSDAPKAIGPYSQAVCFKDLVFTSGQLPLIPETMNFPSSCVKEQTRESLTNLKVVLEKGGSSLKSVLKTTCFLVDMDDFAAFNEVYTEFFGTEGAPARSCFAVAKLPKGALVEIEAIAFVERP
ncbi:RidA family protein [Entomomonas moraniae]|uniref:RidA family protein n=1 Tax=Entomomonas moraniae TaxID=2213226 RepID=A0A3S9XBU2_9GAMM|nr:RidA family protein [Entomomonas moraniae]AZS49889.1 RidA family protein [Entomomonas moraniae]